MRFKITVSNIQCISYTCGGILPLQQQNLSYQPQTFQFLWYENECTQPICSKFGTFLHANLGFNVYLFHYDSEILRSLVQIISRYPLNKQITKVTERSCQKARRNTSSNNAIIICCVCVLQMVQQRTIDAMHDAAHTHTHYKCIV